ncbi:hypothetical protein J7S75_06385 [Providencia huaxiensis]|uniref:hypothetical protein n=1 Tax=Providencia huaxiensis TaxID=2027290 RepID=UPI001B35C89A|nr:hypothetical protein [Providencia huaxiensis]MBQ0533966.1 hypothetical protein [Providencia huaxiensis]MBQ0588665.1 hypothetical protein [Providencia huaxiensis]
MDKSRQQFEEWIADNTYLFMHINLTYHEAALYKLWQASRESLINNLEPIGYMESNGCYYIKRHGFTHINAEQSGSINIPLYKLD